MGSASCKNNDTNHLRTYMRSVEASGGRIMTMNKAPPPLESINYESVFNEHTYCDGRREQTLQLVEPSLDYAIDTSPITQMNEIWVGCLMKSSQDGYLNRTKGINLVLVVDVSGSMGCTLTEPKTEEDLFTLPSKLSVVKESLISLFDVLLPQDRLGIVTFNESAKVVLEMTHKNSITNNQKDELIKKIQSISEGGGTILATGMEKATEMLRKVYDPQCENRIIFFTDMCDTSEDSGGPDKLLRLSQKNASEGMYSSFIGVGVDFDTTVTEKVTKVRASNYFCIFSPEQFKKMLAEEFNYNFFPIAFNVSLHVTLSGESYVASDLYGSPYGDEIKMQERPWTPKCHTLYSTKFQHVVHTLLLCLIKNDLPKLSVDVLGVIINLIAPPLECVSFIDTVFPSHKQKEETKGGLLLLKLIKNPNNNNTETTNTDAPEKVQVKFEIRYTPNEPGQLDRFVYQSSQIAIDLSQKQYYSSTGIQKGLLLQRYTNVLRYIIEHKKNNNDNIDPKQLLNRFISYFQEKAKPFGRALDNECKMLNKFLIFV